MADERPKIQLHGHEYYMDQLGENAATNVAMLTFVNLRLLELRNQKALLHRAKISYVESVKQEVLSKKSGLILEND